MGRENIVRVVLGFWHLAQNIWAAADWILDITQAVRWIPSIGVAAMLIGWLQAAKDVWGSWPLGWQVLFGFGAVLALTPILGPLLQFVLIFYQRRKHFIEAYDDRKTLIKVRLGIQHEIGRARREVWVAWLTGGVAPLQGAFARDKKGRPSKVTKAIFLSPDNPALDYSVEMFPNYTLKGLREDIYQATSMALKGGAKVKWNTSRMPMSAVTIIDPDGWNGFAIVEVFLHVVDAPLRPSIIVTKLKNRQLFNRIKGSVDKLWADSILPTERVPEPSDKDR